MNNDQAKNAIEAHEMGLPWAGDEVIFTGNGGYPSENKAAWTVFDPANRYIVANSDIGAWRTDLEIEGVPGYWNSVLFELAPDSKE